MGSQQRSFSQPNTAARRWALNETELSTPLPPLGVCVTHLYSYAAKYSPRETDRRNCINAQKWRCPCERVYLLLDKCRISTVFSYCMMDSNKNILPRLFQLTPIDFKDEADEVKLILHCLIGVHFVDRCWAPFVVP